MDYIHYIKQLLINDKHKIYNMNKNKTVLSLVQILEDEMNSFDYLTERDDAYLIDMFDILVNLLAGSKGLQHQLYDRFTLIHNIIKNLIHAKPEGNNELIEKKYQYLQKLIAKMENTMLVLYFDNPAEYDPYKEEFIYYVIFRLKYINHVKNACNNFPHIVNSVDKDGIPLIEKVVEKYLESLDIYLSKENLGPIDDLIYYDKVIHLILKSTKIKIDEYNKKLLLDKINNFYEEHDYSSNRLKEKLSFFINDILNTITGHDEKMTIDYLSYKYEIHNKFKEAHNLEAKMISRNNKRIKGNITPREIYTFDGVGAKEIDDGLSITYEDGIYHLGVHIADPTAYIKKNSILYDEAIRRTTSLYMGNYTIPMYPFLISAGTMSLNENKKTYCISYYFDIDELTGELINFDIKSEICIVKKNLTYDDFDKGIDEGVESEDFFNILINLVNVSDILKRVYNEDLIYQKLHSDKEATLSRNVVESAMIYTNYNIAKLFDEKELPFIYRCHKIDEKEIRELNRLQERLREKENTDKIVQNIEGIKEMFPRAFYTRFNTGHYGLGTNFYSHSTSPLRRLADNISNICIKKFLLNEYTKDDIKRMNELIDELAETINSKRASVEDYERQYLKIKYPTL